jgi:tRNA nucleotidyltransferase/poly(A) polymerase
MCRASEEGGRRCNGHNPYGVSKRNLQAKKQYHENKLKENGLSPQQRNKTQKALNYVNSEINSLNEEKKDLGKVRSYVMNLTPATERVLNQLEADGFKPYIVGGSVRDVLLGLDSKDVDIEVYGGQVESISASLRKIGKVDEVGKSFGVLKIAIGKEDFDVSLPRIDSKIGDGHRGFDVHVDPDLSLEEATSRRDYTINALMYSHKLGFIIDKHSGLKDLKDNKLRHVSEAFDEDPLRVLRGVQMASRFGMDLHPDTVTKAQTLKNEYNALAIERVQTEFEKLYSKGKNPAKALKLLKATKWDENFAGLAKVNNEELHAQVTKVQKKIDSGEIPKEKRTLFLSAAIANKLDDPKERMKFLSDTIVGDDTKNAAFRLSTMKAPENVSDESLRNWSKDMFNKDSIRNWTTFESAIGDEKHAQEVFKKAEKLGILDAPEKDFLNGQDIMAKHPNEKPGPWMKEALNKARKAQYAGEFRSREDALNWLKTN